VRSYQPVVAFLTRRFELDSVNPLMAERGVLGGNNRQQIHA
jgi:hypothetical protein